MNIFAAPLGEQAGYIQDQAAEGNDLWDSCDVDAEDDFDDYHVYGDVWDTDDDDPWY